MNQAILTRLTRIRDQRFAMVEIHERIVNRLIRSQPASSSDEIDVAKLDLGEAQIALEQAELELVKAQV